jgi:cysteinyl-tRNA synthetase
MQIYSTLTKTKVDLLPQDGKTLKIYACGLTVYNLMHIGNARTFVVFDTLRRFLKREGKDVLFIRNVTDVDDKIINAANKAQISPLALTEQYCALFQSDAESIRILPPDKQPKVTENMDDIINTVQLLIDNGYAYANDTGVYFSVAKIPDYGALSGNNPDNLREQEYDNRRTKVTDDEEKRDVLDFAIWKSAKPGEPFWDAPFGKGRPGWHIECSVMAEKFADTDASLPATLDLHGGGMDLCFPHHENEIAQSQAAFGRPLSRIWMHVAMMDMNHLKMSKSTGNLISVRDFVADHGGNALRYLLLSAHYRSRINFTHAVSEAAVNACRRMRDCLDAVKRRERHSTGTPTGDPAKLTQTAAALLSSFDGAMADDLNTALAFAAIFDLIRAINTAVAENTDIRAIASARDTLLIMLDVMGLMFEEDDDSALPAEITALVEQRAQARKNKDYAFADTLRTQINERGYIIEETKDGTVIRKA